MSAATGHAQGLPWGLYSDRSTSVTVPFAQPIDFSSGATSGAVLSVGFDSKGPHNFMVDTGSTGIAIGKDSTAWQPAAGQVSVGPGQITYTSSNRVLTGNLYETTVKFYMPGTNDVIATAVVPILQVLSETKDGVPVAGRITTQMFGVGFGREAAGFPNGTPDANPLLNINTISTGDASKLVRGYIITQNGIELGLTAANTQGTTFIRLAAGPTSGNAIEWQMTPGDLQAGGAIGSGTVLPDTGLYDSYIKLPDGSSIKPGARIPKGTLVTVYMPGRIDPAAALYSFRVGDTGNPLAPVGEVYAESKKPTDTGATYINTTITILRGFNLVYDADSGFAGYQRIAPESADLVAKPMIALQGSLSLASQFTTSLPVFLMSTTALNPLDVASLGGDISGPGSLNKTGLGTLELAGNNTYTGGTAILGGTLAVSRDANLGATAAGLTLGGGTLEVLADGFATARPVTLNGSGTLQIDFGTATFAGSIADGSQPGMLIKTGSGTAVLSAANTFTGGALVNAGTLALTTTGSLAAPVLVGEGASFLNAGVISGRIGNLGALNNSGTITGGLINTGLAFNSGLIAGGVANSGSLGNNGIITNGLTNAGLTLNAGIISGGVINSGVLRNSGAIAGGLVNSSAAISSGTIAGGAINDGVLSNTGAIAGGLTNAGTAYNSGAIGGGVTNNGTLGTSGTISGGLTNTGTVLASTGQIDGPIVNNAGLLAISGSVASNGILTNAAGATLAVTDGGAYSLAGSLSNAGTILIDQNTSLTADAGLNNAGLITSDGTLTTDLTNAGIARLSGKFDGTLTNAGLLQITGSLVGLTSLTNTGAVDLGGTAFTLNNFTGPASAVLGNGALTVTGAASSTYAGAILETASPTSLTKAGTGTLTLTGTGRFSGPTTIQAGTLTLNGLWTSPVAVAAAGTLRGIGTIAAPVAVAGALRPGNSPGTLTVLGPVAFAPGSSLGLDIDGPGTGTGAGSYARLLALGSTGTVAANGTLVPVLRGITGNATNSFAPALGQRFGVLTAQGGLSGSFTGLAQPTAGLPVGTRFDALYSATGLDLVVTPAAYSNLAGLGLAQTGNAQAVGAALDVARPAAATRPDAAQARVFDPLYAANPATLPGGLASLSGQSYGDAVMTDLAARRLITDTIDRHQRGLGGGATAFSAGDPGLGPNGTALQVRGGAGAADRPLAVGDGRVWADALYGFGARAGDRVASGAGFDTGGLLLGVDQQVGADTEVGGAFSYLREGGTSRGAGLGRFTTDSYGGTLYASTRLGAVVLRGTAGVSYADGRIDRTVALGSAVSQASGLSSGWNGGVSGFAGYALATGLPVEVVPEVGFSYDRLTRGPVAERGGLVNQGFGGQGFAVADLDAARSLVGGRVTSVAFAGVPDLRLEGRAYWAHELADTYTVVRSGLFGAAFASRTSALGRDGAVLGVSLMGAVAEGVQLSLGYTGDLRSGATAQVVSAGLRAAW
ncbi:autotransporter outer membrane beta-barrel domain-containing protein [Methylobacterium sp. ARG-1]|uniref:autotransporter outer membrane beta-barrel domain-containing protein n=1 Tax=Methylobacterium sp. ARG-1 TaxID=1692501 RepID=UPI000A661DDC|nr:autotransporter outer membrane beta-barrel domain-containing protein [Methylobacterium sp. ARG-1]